MMATLEKHVFQAETTRLLDLMIHSLYTNKEIFLRELISNASDALDRFRIESLQNPDLLEGDDRLEIRIRTNPAARTVTISDNGVGMTHDELLANIGTIARSGTREVREKLTGDGSPEGLAALIGQFGVGFYAAFMVAERIVLTTRRAGTRDALRWESTGDGTYEVSESEQRPRGTTITLHLRPPNPAEGLEDFADKWRISTLVTRYSDFISYPIVFEEWREEPVTDAQGHPLPGEAKAPTVEDKILNARTPIWTRPQQSVSTDDYHQFYRHLAHDWNDPMKVLSYRAEGRHEFVALLFIPSKAPADLYYHAPDTGLRLFSQRVMVLEKTDDLLPRYLRFLKGVVDATDLPLHISRQRLQLDRDIATIRRWLTRKVLESLGEMQATAPERYTQCWHEFGRALKEGVSSDFENKERLIDLLLFESSHDPTALTSLRAYADRMPAEQEHIFYLTGASRTVVENSPHVEAVREKGYEVLYLVDPVDELLVQMLTEFNGKKLKSVGKGRLSVGSAEDREREDAELEASRADFEPLLQTIAKHLEAEVKQARLSTRLTKTPVCLVVEEHDYSPQLERLLHKGKGGGPQQRRVLELNPTHPLCVKLLERHRADASDPYLAQAAQVLFNAALLAEGSELPDPVPFTRTLFALLELAR
jgi:molecular chaperone HtpG